MDQYSVGRVLGSGSFGTVFECTDRATGESLACKVIDKTKIKGDDDWENLRAEVQVLTMLRSQFQGQAFTQLKSAVETEDKLYLVMEKCEGGDLFDLLNNNGKLPEGAAKHLFGQLACGLATLHAQGIVHRDIKPENILLDIPATSLYNDADVILEDTSAEVRAKLADFGLSTVLTPGTKTTCKVGSLRTTAPEIVQGLPHGRPVDVWSLGVVLYTMLTGKYPFAGKTSADDEGLANSILLGRVNFEAQRWKGVSLEAKDLVSRMLKVDPSRRLSVGNVVNHPWMSSPGPTPAHALAVPLIAAVQLVVG